MKVFVCLLTVIATVSAFSYRYPSGIGYGGNNVIGGNFPGSVRAISSPYFPNEGGAGPFSASQGNPNGGVYGSYNAVGGNYPASARATSPSKVPNKNGSGPVSANPEKPDKISQGNNSGNSSSKPTKPIIVDSNANNVNAGAHPVPPLSNGNHGSNCASSYVFSCKPSIDPVPCDNSRSARSDFAPRMGSIGAFSEHVPTIVDAPYVYPQLPNNFYPVLNYN